MANHGVITVGSTLERAYAASIAVETTAETLIYARAMGWNPTALDDQEISKLYQLYQSHKPRKC
jgi:ribulose-5-phosphate 4-epimerase/fuculose-1-phosphate aldolase